MAPGYHLHDGFFVRLAVGISYVNLKVAPKIRGYDAIIYGAGIAYETDFGGTPLRQLVLGVGSSLISAPAIAGVAGRDEPGDAAVTAFMIGPFATVFPDPTKNVEFGGSLGYSGAFYRHHDAEGREDDSYRDYLNGGAAAVWAGYGWWVTPNCALGGLFRASVGLYSGHASTSRSPSVGFDEAGTGWSVSLLFNPVFQ